MNTELLFFSKVVRNALILAGLYFVSIWTSTQQLDFLMHIKPILIFMITYVATEAAKRYKVDIKDPKLKNKSCTMIL